MKSRVELVCAIAVLALVAASSFAQSSLSTVTYQGILHQASAPIPDGTYTLIFKLWDTSTPTPGQTPIESITVSGIQTSRGQFTAAVPVKTQSFPGTDRWWTITHQSTELLPRQKISAVPYALTSASLASGSQLVVNHDERNSYAAFITNSDAGGQGLRIKASDGGGTWNLLRVDDRDGNLRFGVNADGRATTRVLEILGGSDIAEPFPGSPTSIAPIAGMVMCIDPSHPGSLRVSETPYDTTVAGVYSGANGLPTGLVLGHDGDARTRAGIDRLPIAMTGRVWVYASEPEDIPNSKIEPGDRLTTSSIPGYAMKVIDPARAPGAVIGKAMTPRDKETGMVLVLVNLQ